MSKKLYHYITVRLDSHGNYVGMWGWSTTYNYEYNHTTWEEYTHHYISVPKEVSKASMCLNPGRRVKEPLDRNLCGVVADYMEEHMVLDEVLRKAVDGLRAQFRGEI